MHYEIKRKKPQFFRIQPYFPFASNAIWLVYATHSSRFPLLRRSERAAAAAGGKEAFSFTDTHVLHTSVAATAFRGSVVVDGSNRKRKSAPFYLPTEEERGNTFSTFFHASATSTVAFSKGCNSTDGECSSSFLVVIAQVAVCPTRLSTIGRATKAWKSAKITTKKKI